MILINFVDQHLLRVLVRNMPYHYCRAAIILDLVDIYFEFLIFTSYWCRFSLSLLLRQSHKEILITLVRHLCIHGNIILIL